MRTSQYHRLSLKADTPVSKIHDDRHADSYPGTSEASEREVTHEVVLPGAKYNRLRSEASSPGAGLHLADNPTNILCASMWRCREPLRSLSPRSNSLATFM